MLKPGERAKHEDGSDEQHQRERHLDRDESGAKAVLPAVHSAAAARAQHNRGGSTGEPDGRPQAGDDADEHRDSEGERQHRAIEFGFGAALQRGCEQQPGGSQQAISERDPKYAPRQRIQDALRKKLTNELPPPGAEGGAHRHFAFQSHAPREQQAGEVHAPDRRQREHRVEQQMQGVAGVAGGERGQLDQFPPPAFRRRVPLAETREHAVELLFRGLGRHTRREASRRGNPVAAAIIPLLSGRMDREVDASVWLIGNRKPGGITPTRYRSVRPA